MSETLCFVLCEEQARVVTLALVSFLRDGESERGRGCSSALPCPVYAHSGPQGRWSGRRRQAQERKGLRTTHVQCLVSRALVLCTVRGALS